MNKFEIKTPPSMLEFRHTSVANEWVMRITADKRKAERMQVAKRVAALLVVAISIGCMFAIGSGRV